MTSILYVLVEVDVHHMAFALCYLSICCKCNCPVICLVGGASVPCVPIHSMLAYQNAILFLDWLRISYNTTALVKWEQSDLLAVSRTRSVDTSRIRASIFPAKTMAISPVEDMSND